jgi:hypothetical protein
MKRKATVDTHIQADAKTAFRRLRLEINQLDRNRQQLRRGQDDYTPTPVGLDVLMNPSQAATP